MARYGQDFDQGRFGDGGRAGMQGEYGRDYTDYGYGGPTRGRYGAGYGGMRSDRLPEERYGYGGGGGYGGSEIGGGGYGRTDYADRGGYGGGRAGSYDLMYGPYGSSYGGSQRGGYNTGAGYTGGYGGYADYLDEQQGGYRQGGGYGGTGAGLRERQGQATRVRISEIMTENPETVTGDATLADAAKKMRDINVGIIPVVESAESRRLKGVVTDRDIAVRAVAEGKDPNKTSVSDIMTTDVDTCNQNDTMQAVLDLMERDQVRRVPITDREGRLVGIVAQADVAVDFVSGGPGRDRQMAEVVERISEPGRPRRGQGGQQGRGQPTAMQARGAQSAGRQSGSRSGQQSQSGPDQQEQPAR